VTLDIGAGDGRYVLSTAAADPRHLVVAVDADRAGLAAGFSRASRRRLDNAIFVVAPAEELPAELDGLAGEVRIQFPWGSLLRLVLSAQGAFVHRIGSLLEPGGRLVIALSLTPRDGVAASACVDEQAAHGLLARIEAGAPFAGGGVTAITPEIARTLHSTWANRLRVGHQRPGWLLQTVRE